MKTLLVAINSKFIHLSLAPWYIKEACGNSNGEINVREFTINDNINSILSILLSDDADIYAFSCYIWNIEYVIKLCSDIKKVKPESYIILGGPEVWYDTSEILNSYSFIDYIISGEGEKSFKQLISVLHQNKKELSMIPGLSYRDETENIVSNACYIDCNLDDIPSPYTEEMMENMENKIVYFESSRGCPFSCSYCLSSTFDGVRYFNLDRVKSELLKLINRGVGQVKFVDRTFNSNKKRAKEIFRFIIEHGNENINFHFEAAADLFDEEMFSILHGAPKGLIQFEIGIQSTNLRTLEAVKRKTDIDQVLNNIRRLLKPGNIHVHVDLIAGLPYETFELFQKSFNEVYKLSAHNLQLGFLKLLKGSDIKKNAEKYAYKYRDYPPYEVLYNNFIDFHELSKLKDVEETLERYYNSGRFVQALKYITENLFLNPFDFYYDFSGFNRQKGYLDNPVSAQRLYDILISYIDNKFSKFHSDILNELLKFDYLRSNNTGNVPGKIQRIEDADFNRKCFEFLKKEGNIQKYLPQHKGHAVKQVFRNVHFELFNYDLFSLERCRSVVLFDYKDRDRVTQLYNYHILNTEYL